MSDEAVSFGRVTNPRFCCKIYAQFFNINGDAKDGIAMKGNELRKHVLVGKKTERLVFAVTPEMKAAIEHIADEKGTSISSMLTQLTTDEILANEELFKESK